MEGRFIGKLKQLITDALRDSKRSNIETLIAAMESGGFFTYWSASHHNWDGGTAEHSWQVYQFMLYLKEHPNRALIRYKNELANIPKDSIIIVGLLHDLGKMRGNASHNKKAVRILRQYKVDIHDSEMAAILSHHTPHILGYDKDRDILNTLAKLGQSKDVVPLVKLVQEADHISSGTAWHAEFFKKGSSQAKDNQRTYSIESRRRNAFDRTLQALEKHMYCDCNMKFHNIYSGYNLAKTFYKQEFDISIKKKHNTEFSVIDSDYLNIAKNLKNDQPDSDVCILVGGDGISPVRGFDSGREGTEKSLMICTNMPKAFAAYDSHIKRDIRHYSIKDDIKDQYPLDKHFGGVFIKDVTVIRDSECNGFQFVEPWKTNIIIVRGKHLRGIWNKEIETIMRDKIKTMFRIAYANGQNKIVIPAFGTDGTWNNPQDKIANLFNEVLKSEEFEGVFESVCFAVPFNCLQFYQAINKP